MNEEKKDEGTDLKKTIENRPQRNKTIKIIILIIGISILLCLIFSVIFALLNINNDKIVKGVMIEGIDVSTYTKDDLQNKLTDLTESNNGKDIILKYEDSETEITPNDIETTYNIQDVVDEAYSIGRSGNIFVNNFEILQALLFKKNIQIESTFDDDKLDSIYNSVNQNLPGVVEQPDYYIDGENLIITKGKAGITVNTEELGKEIKEVICEYSTSDIVITIPVENVVPDSIDIDKIHSEIYKEAQDAYISEDPLTVHPNVDGVDFAITIDEAKKIIEEDKDEYTIPLKITIANKTINDLGEEAFPSKLGNFSTKFDVSNTNRSTNIKLATDKINGTIVMPGETFSYNQIVGKRTIEAGYKEAGAYVGGEIVQEVGGGICQVSSTLYNAVLYANLEIVERSNHCFESSYVDAGRDATVSWGTVDFKFKNNRTYPIKIVATSKNGVETVSIYGIPETTEYEIIIQSKVISTIDRTVKYVDDDTIEEGKEVISQTGHDGCVSETYKIVRLNGETISTTLLSKDTYKALEKIIKRGTKVTETENEDEVVTDNTKNTENTEDTNTTQSNTIT